jgi:C1A family cysteine protease
MHAVKLIGWGEEEGGTAYWIYMNSYGRSWGENGTYIITNNITTFRIIKRVIFV